MSPIAEMAGASRLRGLLFDIDDTLTTEGRLTAEAYTALERLKQAGRIVVPITGRPAGWCDHIARTWPVDAVVGENGAFYFRHAGGKLIRKFRDDEHTRRAHRKKLLEIGAEVMRQFPGCAMASDQPYRETDLAIDYCEDVLPLPQARVLEIAALMHAAGLTAKVSSIHVNGWFGAYDKLGMSRQLFEEVFGVGAPALQSDFAFAGDSPNDEPMFAWFDHSVGVANVARFEAQLAQKPKYVTRGAAGAGFAELAQQMLGDR